MTELVWSNGGPLIMVAEHLLPWWGGVENRGGLASADRGCFTSGAACDYDRAGAVEGWVGAVPIQDGTGVVFWGDHLALGLRPLAPSRLLVVRPWHHMDDLDDRLAALIERPPPFAPDFGFSITAERFAVFDSANPEFDVRPPVLWGRLEPGWHEVSTCDEASARRIGITLHLLERKD